MYREPGFYWVRINRTWEIVEVDKSQYIWRLGSEEDHTDNGWTWGERIADHA